jgi:hypothetical protein
VSEHILTIEIDGGLPLFARAVDQRKVLGRFISSG